MSTIIMQSSIDLGGLLIACVVHFTFEAPVVYIQSFIMFSMGRRSLPPSLCFHSPRVAE